MNENGFFCIGKYAGSSEKRFTPGGLPIQEFLVAVTTKIPWKEKKTMHLRITCGGKQVNCLNSLKTGDLIKVKGLIEDTGAVNNKKTRLIAIEISKEIKEND